MCLEIFKNVCRYKNIIMFHDREENVFKEGVKNIGKGIVTTSKGIAQITHTILDKTISTVFKPEVDTREELERFRNGSKYLIEDIYDIFASSIKLTYRGLQAILTKKEYGKRHIRWTVYALIVSLGLGYGLYVKNKNNIPHNEQKTTKILQKTKKDVENLISSNDKLKRLWNLDKDRIGFREYAHDVEKKFYNKKVDIKEVIKKDIADILKHIDYEKIKDKNKFNSAQWELFNHVKKFILIPDNVVKIITVEVGNNNEENVIDLFNKGEGWKLTLTASGYDKYLSYGPYQLTSFVVRKDDSKIGNANLFEKLYVKKDGVKIPSSMFLLNSFKQHTAAFVYNYLFNAIELIKGNGELIKKLQHNKRKKYVFEKTPLFVLAMHNNPKLTKREFSYYLSNSLKKKVRLVIYFKRNKYLKKLYKSFKKTRNNHK